jgi:dTDP-4-amino-4,6-dideoxygalactose transaminase
MTSIELRELESYWQSEVPGVSVPVARPRLPTADEIAPYLHRIDKSHWYSNSGPLVQEFEERLENHFGQEKARVATVSNGTIGLTAALLAHELPRASLCMVPAWTFAATGHAIELAGLIPWIVDVCLTSWALEPDASRELLKNAPGKVSAVMPVSPFGAPINYDAWESFRDDTGLAVVIDAAAAFDTVRATSVPAVVSLHATKLLGVGEGGLVLTSDANFAQEIQKRSNFGFWYSRESKVQSLNGKMSEYTAAVGLASLDSWQRARADFERVGRAYRRGFAGEPNVVLHGSADRWVSSTVVVVARDPLADAIGQALAAKGIGSRHWWGGGLHRHAAFEHFPRAETKNTDNLVNRVIGLPCWRDLPDGEVARVCDVVVSACT